MNLTLVLLKFFGFYLTGVGLCILVNPKQMEGALKDLKNSKFDQLMAGILPLLIGGFLVAAHNTWGNAEEIMVSLFSWAFLLAGAYRLIFTEHWLKIVGKVKVSSFMPISFVCVLAGVALLYLGYIN